jgi:hypothetical protein
MMQLAENRSQIWYKVLSGGGKPIDGSPELWSLPDQYGEIEEFNNQHGTWLVSNPKDFYQEGNHVYVAEIIGNPIIERPGVIWVNKVRLVRLANEMDLKQYGIFPSSKNKAH